MRKSLFNYFFYSHPEIGNFKVWQGVSTNKLLTVPDKWGQPVRRLIDLIGQPADKSMWAKEMKIALRASQDSSHHFG
jgi:hypothetical protein